MEKNTHLEKVLPTDKVSIANFYGNKPTEKRSLFNLAKLIGVSILGVGLTGFSIFSIVHAEHRDAPKMTPAQIDAQVNYIKDEMQQRINEFAKEGSLKGACAVERESGIVGSVKYKGHDAYIPMGTTAGVTPSDAERKKFDEPTHSDCKPANYYDGESAIKSFPLPDTNNPNDPRVKQIIKEISDLYKADLEKTNGATHNSLQDPTPKG